MQTPYNCRLCPASKSPKDLIPALLRALLTAPKAQSENGRDMRVEGLAQRGFQVPVGVLRIYLNRCRQEEWGIAEDAVDCAEHDVAQAGFDILCGGRELYLVG